MTDFSFEAEAIRNAVVGAAWSAHDRLTAPHVLYKPELTADGDMWCALYGKDLQDGVAGFGATPAEAMDAFDKAWRSERTPAARVKDRELIHPDSQFGVGA